MQTWGKVSKLSISQNLQTIFIQISRVCRKITMSIIVVEVCKTKIIITFTSN